MTHVSASLTITDFRLRHDDGSETTATWIAAQNTDFGVTADTTFRTRLLVAETAGGAAVNETFQFQYRHVEGTNTWTNIDAASSVIRAVTSANFTDGDDCTQQLGAGTFILNNDGMTHDGLSGGGNTDYAGNDEAETECSMTIRSVDVTEGDTIEVRCLIGGIVPAGTPTLPLITVGTPRDVTQNRGGAGDLTTVTMSASSTVTKTIKRNVPCTTAVLEQAFGGFGTTTVNTYDLSGQTFESSTWTNPSNASDGSTSTFAQGSSNSGSRWTGTTIPNSGSNVITQIRGRWYLSTDDPTFDRAELFWGTGGTPSVTGYGGHYDQPTISNPTRVGTTTPGWTDWYYVNPAPEEAGAGTIVDPYDWAYASDWLGTILVGGIPSSDNRLYTAQFEVTTGLAYDGYLDGTPTDSDAVWSNDANLVDGSTSTGASTSTAMTGEFTDNFITASGTTVNSAISGDIHTVVMRVHYTAPVLSAGAVRVLDGSTNLTDGSGSLNYYPLYSSVTDYWGPWRALNKQLLPGGEWTQAVLDGLTVEAGMLSSQTGTLTINKIEFKALAEDFNPQGATVEKTFGRVAAGSTAALEFDSQNITLDIDRSLFPRGLATEQLSVAASATVTRPAGREVSGKTDKKKNWRGLHWSVFDFDGAIATWGGTNHENAWDGDEGTQYQIFDGATGAKGCSTAYPTLSPTAVPIRMEVRALYGTNGSTGISVQSGFDRGNQRDEWTTIDRYTLAWDGFFENTAAENWTNWAPVNGTGYNDWADQGATNFTEPLTWQMIREHLIVYLWSTGSNPNIRKVELRVLEAEPTVTTGYFDASLGWEDNEGKWQGQANAFDGSTTTWAKTEHSGITNWLEVKGNTITQGSAEDEILDVYVRARVRMQYDVTNPAVGAQIFPYHPDYGLAHFPVVLMNDGAFKADDGLSFSSPDYTNGSYPWQAPATNTAFWTGWQRLSFADIDADLLGTRDWKSWGEIEKLSMRVNRGSGDHDGAELEVSKFEIAVVSAPPNADRKTKIKKDRGVTQDSGQIGDLSSLVMAGNQADISFAAANRTVTGITQAIEWDGTNYDATVTRDRVATGATQALALDGTTYPATVNTERGVTGLTQALAWDGTNYDATVTRDRVATGATQALAWDGTTYPATVTRDRVATGATQALAWDGTTYPATISFSTNLVVTGLTQALAWDGTTYDATIKTDRGVVSATEALTLTETAGSVNGTRIAAGSAELMVLAGTDATVNRGFVLDAVTAANVMVGASNVNLERGVGGLTEALALTENSAIVAANRGVLSATETLSLTESASTVSAARLVTGNTEVLTLADNDSTTNRQRGVNAGTEALSLTESAATVTLGQHRDVICTPEVLEVTSTSSINRTLDIAATTEVLSLTESAATANLARNRVSPTEALTLTESAATIDTSAGNIPRDVTCSTEVLAAASAGTTVVLSRNVPCNSEVLQTSSTGSFVQLSRGVLSSTEVVNWIDNTSSINASRVTSGVTEALILAGTNAIVSTSTNRIVTGLTSPILLAESAAVANVARGVSSLTEQLVMAGDSSVARVRNVTGQTEVLTQTSTNASANLTRGVAGLTEALLLTEFAASVFRGANLDVTANSAVMLLAGELATIVNGRSIVCTPESLILAGSGAIVDASRLVASQSETLVLTEVPAKITKTRFDAQPGEMVYVHPTDDYIFIDNRLVKL